MNYRKDYIQIIRKAKEENRQKLFPWEDGYVYYESHHVLPRSLFPRWETRKSNTVYLTAKEHFICHLLLAKIYPGPQMAAAVEMMSRVAPNQKREKLTSREYALTREVISESWTKEWREEWGKRQKERLKDPEFFKNSIGKANKTTRQKVKNIETGKIFDSMTEAGHWAGLKAVCKIGEVCRGTRPSAGKVEGTEIPATWEYVGQSERLQKHPVEIFEHDHWKTVGDSRPRKTNVRMWTNGKENKRCKEQPGPEWWLGITKKNRLKLL